MKAKKQPLKQDTPLQIVFRASPEFFDRMDKLAKQKTEPGLVLTRTDVLRMAAFRGLELLEAEAKEKRP